MLKTYCFQYKFNVANKGLDKNCAIMICERRLQRSRVRFSLTTNKLGLAWNPNAYSLLPNTCLDSKQKMAKGFSGDAHASPLYLHWHKPVYQFYLCMGELSFPTKGLCINHNGTTVLSNSPTRAATTQKTQ